ncbi:hypothetical protein SARC_10940 [Sphaeroforma arctica JP610]|uniref:Uncharacterized protein n=1 Tax=Sphaeroforma arctica JP610 TaxID=667725 RepID=A0A0L0FJE5_9EUKA|nr:hypothetical protein SARC_10940 [Sphaeroforma arctica JP610]KNC76566.1 hypothetical protein SARC_10940 [Sphaeroforma arctica JP610]|eukprot:XP_014150468.1 hypothetical protein SARC_10940 [Sphaeroforma arctica JP610]
MRPSGHTQQYIAAVHNSQAEDHVTPTVRRTTRLTGGETEKAVFETQDTGFTTNTVANRSLQSKLGAADGGDVHDVGNSSQTIEQVRTTGHGIAPTYSDNAGLDSAEDKDVHTVQKASEEIDTHTVNVGSKHEANPQSNDMADINCGASMPSPLSDVDCSQMIEGSRQEEAADSAPTQTQPITSTELHVTDTPDSDVEVEAETHNQSQDSEAKAHNDIQSSVYCKEVSGGACVAVAGSGSSASEDEEGGYVSAKEAKSQSEVSPKQSDLECAPEPIGQAQDNEV